MKTVNRDVTITLQQLREAVLAMNDKLRGTELAKLPNDHLALVHAYQLGCVMAATGVSPDSIDAIVEFVRIGYNDFHLMKADEEGEADG